jgi:hypothetical protein
METTDTQVQEAPLHYNPNQLVTYKVIDIDDTYATPAVAHYPTIKVVDLEWELEQGRRQVKKTNNLQSKINQIIDNMTEDYWYNPNTTKETILNDICEILDFNPVKEIEFTATMKFTGRIDVPLLDYEDFNLEDVLAEAYVDINNGEVIIDGYELYDAEEC